MIKALGFSLALALITVPAIASAADAAPAAAASPATCRPSPEQTHRILAGFHSFARKTLPAFKQMRSQVLDALTPDHRAAIGKLMGDLLVSPNPDLNAAGKAVDAMLTPTEQQAVRTAFGSFALQAMSNFLEIAAEYHGGMPSPSPDKTTPYHGGMSVSSFTNQSVGSLLVLLLGPAATLSSIPLEEMTSPAASQSPAASPSPQP
jgi:hypothetical protein